MRVIVHADDGHNASVVISEKTTAEQLVESFVKLRALTAKSEFPDVNSNDFLLVYEEAGSGNVHSFGQDIEVEKALKGFPRGGRLVCMGYKAHKRGSALSDLYGFTARMTMISAVLARSLGHLDDETESQPSESGVGEKVQTLTESYIAEVHKALDGALAMNDGTDASLLAAKGKLVFAYPVRTLVV
jgi:hypothetical protein